MTLDRRHFLRTSVAVSAVVLTLPPGAIVDAAAASIAHVPASVMQSRGILLLRFTADDDFAAAARDVAHLRGAIVVSEFTLAGNVSVPGRLHDMLSEHRGTHVMGLMDDFAHVLLEEAIRDVNGSILCRGRHRGLPHERAASRHAFETTSSTHGIGAALAGALSSDDTRFCIQERSLTSGVSTTRTVPAVLPAAWSRAVGAAYAIMALGSWRPGAVHSDTRRGPCELHPRSEALVSLLAVI